MGRKGRSITDSEPATTKNVITFPGSVVGKPAPILFGEQIKAARTAKKMSQEELAQFMGVTRHSVMNWESDKSRPDYEMVPQLCSLLEISIQDLFGIKPEYSVLETQIISNVRELKPRTQIMVSKMIENMVLQEAEDEYNKVKDSTRIVPLESSGAAAGVAGAGVPFNDIAPTPFFLRMNEENRRADAVLQVSGHSMEPEYKNGRYVYFEFVDAANPGDDVVLRWGDTAFIKRLDEDGFPYSINPDYPFEYEGDGEDLSIIGRVLGIVTGEDMPPRKYEGLLPEMFEEELREFHQEYGSEY